MALTGGLVPRIDAPKAWHFNVRPMMTPPKAIFADFGTSKFVCFLLVTYLGFVVPQGFAQTTTFYFVRHAEVGSEGLSEIGKARAQVLADTLRDIPFTHVFAPHTQRTLQTVEPTAKRRGLSVIQLPVLGSMVNGE